MGDVDAAGLARCHWLLLRLAGTAPDELMTQCRFWLGEGRVHDVERALTSAARVQLLSLPASEIDPLAPSEAGEQALTLIGTFHRHPAPVHGFVATRAHPRHGSASGPPPPEGQDSADAAVVRWVSGAGGVRSVWRAWRHAGDGTVPPQPRRVYVVEVDGDTELISTTVDVQIVLTALGDSSPQVEVYPVGADLPAYQRLARLCGLLLWTCHAIVRPAPVPGPGGSGVG